MADSKGAPNPIPMTREEVSAMDLRNAAYHEAAHVVVAHSLGYEEAAAIVFAAWGGAVDEVDFVENVLWRGKTLLPDPDTDDRRIIGLAGELAVYLLEEPDPDVHWWASDLRFEMDSISETDRDFIAGYMEEHVDRALALVRERWSDIEELAAELVTQGRRLERGEPVASVSVRSTTHRRESAGQFELFESEPSA